MHRQDASVTYPVVYPNMIIILDASPHAWASGGAYVCILSPAHRSGVTGVNHFVDGLEFID